MAIIRPARPQLEDLIRYYAPARFLCGLTETEWSPDANTIQDFEQLLGEDGIKLINEQVVQWAVEEKLADPKVVVADTTAQEAPIPYPNEVRLMATFVSAIAAASKSVGTALKGFVQRAGGWFQTAKKKLREFRLFAKNKAKTVRLRLMSGMANLVEKVQDELAPVIDEVSRQKVRLTKYRKVAWAKVQHLHRTMRTLLPQIRYWIKTGWVAANKIVSLQMPEVYSIVRGKVGKTACEHIGAAFSAVLEDKIALGLAEPPADDTTTTPGGLVARAIAERAERARAEKMVVRSADPAVPWTDYAVTSADSGRTYRVGGRYQGSCRLSHRVRIATGGCSWIGDRFESDRPADLRG